MAQPLDGIWDRICRAQEHLDAIKAELLAYYQADGSRIRGEYDPEAEGGKGAVRNGEVVIGESGPHLNTLIGEFLHDLRSSLDHLAWQLVLHAGKTPTRETRFPITNTDPGTGKKGQRRSSGVPGDVSAAAGTLVGAAQPYQWGDRYAEHPLWLLHQLWNIDKHRHVIARGSRTKVVLPGWDPPGFKFTSRLDTATEHGAKLLLIPDEPDVDVDAYTTVEVAIYEPDYGIERPLLTTLEQVHEAVDALVRMAEATCFDG